MNCASCRSEKSVSEILGCFVPDRSAQLYQCDRCGELYGPKEYKIANTTDVVNFLNCFGHKKYQLTLARKLSDHQLGNDRIPRQVIMVAKSILTILK